MRKIDWTPAEAELPVSERNALVRARNARQRARDRIALPVAALAGFVAGAIAALLVTL